jgi:uncharacterized protein YcaQ
MLARIGAVQIDTISVLARSHLLVTWARLGALAPDVVEADYWSDDTPQTFEYWSHAACILPIERWPLFEFKRRERRARGRRWHRLSEGEKSLEAVRTQLRERGPLSANQLGGAKGGGPWWDWTESKIAVEWLLDIGEVVCVKRRGFARVYDLAERAVPPTLLARQPSDDECHVALIDLAGAALGIATTDEIAAYNGQSNAQVRRHIGASSLIEITVENDPKPNFADPGALERLGARFQGRTMLLSPFDSLIWYRPRAERLFGLVHRLEAYTPAHKRVHGYFAMPILVGDRFVGRIDPKREQGTLIGAHVSLIDERATDAAIRALKEAARWIGAASIEVGRVTPGELEATIRSALTSREALTRHNAAIPR